MSEAFSSALSRQHYLDNLKVLLIVLVILQHAGQPYGSGGLWWIAAEKVPLANLLVLGTFFAVNMAFFMGLFFFISAFFVGNSYERKGATKYLKDRVIRLGIPILILVIVFPIMKYLLFTSSTPFSIFYVSTHPGEPSGQSSFSLEYLWFLFLLLLFNTIYVAWRILFKSPSLPKVVFPSTRGIIGFVTLMTISMFVTRIWSPINVWLPFGLFEPAHFPQYAMMFFAGLLAYRNDWLNKMPMEAAKRWLSVAGWSLLAFGIMYGIWGNAMLSGGFTIPSLAMAAWESTMCASMSLGLLSLFRTRFNSTNITRTTLSKSSYTAYLTHAPIIAGLQYMLVDGAMPSLAKFAIVSLAGVPLTFLLSDLIRRLPHANAIL